MKSEQQIVSNETCPNNSATKPSCVLLESTDFESTIRLAVSIGGDSDTIAAIAGSIAEAYYDIPQHIQDHFVDLSP